MGLFKSKTLVLFFLSILLSSGYLFAQQEEDFEFWGIRLATKKVFYLDTITGKKTFIIEYQNQSPNIQYITSVSVPANIFILIDKTKLYPRDKAKIYVVIDPVYYKKRKDFEELIAIRVFEKTTDETIEKTLTYKIKGFIK